MQKPPETQCQLVQAEEILSQSKSKPNIQVNKLLKFRIKYENTYHVNIIHIGEIYTVTKWPLDVDYITVQG